MEDKEKKVVDLDAVKMTKTYSISMGDVVRVKKVAEKLGLSSDAEALHQAIEMITKQAFPEGYPPKDAGNG